MRYRSTERQAPLVDFQEALLRGLAPDGGLYMPEEIPRRKISDGSFPEMAAEVLRDFVPTEGLVEICQSAFSFPVPLRHLKDNLYLLDLTMGPTASFKDFGARFMARSMSQALKPGQLLNIVVATSGDTGGAVAAGFAGVAGIKVFILYPSKRVTNLQEKQMTTLGGNVCALEVDGDFDDCHRVAKEILKDEILRKEIPISSANSINIGRLLPQMTYYFWAEAMLRLGGVKRRPIFVVPSGNFGNLTAGLFARAMGLPSELFVAAVNRNCAVPEYLVTGNMSPKKTVRTLSNAMDVGRPDNWDRIMDLHDYDRGRVGAVMRTGMVDDRQVEKKMAEFCQYENRDIDPHTAVGLCVAYELCHNEYRKTPVVVLSTADAGKFKEVWEKATGRRLELASRLKEVLAKKKESILVSPNKEEVVKIIRSRQ
ncbi:MAG: threonine synthase [bacterium]|nr:threonine synthase [bacterium]